MFTNKNRVTFIANSMFTILNFRSELIDEFLLNNYDVLIIVPFEDLLGENLELLKRLTESGVQVVRVKLNRNGLNPLADVRYLVNIYLILKKYKPTIVLNYTIKPTIYGSIAAGLLGVNKISSNMTGLGYAFIASGFKVSIIRSILKLQLRLALRFNYIVFFQNPDDLSDFKRYKILSSDSRYKVINGSGVNLSRFNCSESPRKVPNSFIFVGRLLKDKGILEFLKSADNIKKHFPSAKFTVLGGVDSNPNSISIETLFDYVNRGIVEYIPHTPDVISVLIRAEVFVLPSYREGTPRSVLEAMALNMPIITTDAPGCRETVVEGENGYLVPVKDVESLTNRMMKFLIEPEIIEKMGNSSRFKVCLKYDVNKVNGEILSELL